MKINFRYSREFEERLNPQNNAILESFPSLEKYFDEMRKFWEKDGPEIEKEVKKLLALSFPKEVTCYFNTGHSFSDPLSLKLENIDDMKDNLIHELLHIVLTHNYSKIEKKWEKLFDRYKEESAPTKRHLLIHDVHYLITKKFYPDRLENIIKYSEHKDYVRSWEIVLKEPGRIIEEFKKL